LHDGTYCLDDGAVYIESQSEYYRYDDEDIVEDHNNEWQMREDCVELANGEWAQECDTWCCESSGEYYLEGDEDPVVIHGLNFHPDTSAEDIATTLDNKQGQVDLFIATAERAAGNAPIVISGYALATPETV